MGRHAIKTPPHHATWQTFLDTWIKADRIEVFESAWNWDHFLRRRRRHRRLVDAWRHRTAAAWPTGRSLALITGEFGVGHPELVDFATSRTIAMSARLAQWRHADRG